MAMEEDLTPFFDEAVFAHALTWHPSDGSDTQTGSVLLDEESERLAGGMVQSTNRVMLYQATELVGLVQGEVVEIGDVEYSVAQPPEPVDDGAMLRAELVRVIG